MKADSALRGASLAYRLALRALPFAWRHRHDAEMLHVFDQLARDAWQSGGLRGVGRHLRHELRGLAVGAAAERRERSRLSLPLHHPTGRPLMFDTLWQDLRVTVRSHARHPGTSVLAVAIVAAGMAASIAVFAIAHAYLWRALPFPDAERLVEIRPFVADQAPPPAGMFGLHWLRRPELASLLDDVVAWDLDGFNITGADRAEPVTGAWVSPGYFTAAGVKPLVGRIFGAEALEPGTANVVLLGYDLWQRRYGGDPSIVGRTITAYSTDRPFEAETFTVIGILDRHFWFFNQGAELLAPLRGPRFPAYGRLRPGVTTERVSRELTAIATSELGAGHPDWRIAVLPAHEAHVAEARPMLLTLLAAAALLLLVVCGNVAMLLLLRAAGRQREIAVRRALGAGTWRVARLLLSEGIVLAVVGGLLGLWIGQASLSRLGAVIEAQMTTRIPGGAAALGVDARVALVAIGVTLLSGFVFGLVPLAGSRTDLVRSLNQGGRSATPSRRQRLIRTTLVGAEIALSLGLLLGATLIARSAWHLHHLPIGFEAEGVLKANLSLPVRFYQTPADRRALFDRLIGEVSRLPGVASASIVNVFPFRFPDGAPIAVEGRPPEAWPRAVSHTASPDYFRTLQIPLQRGRLLTAQDGENSQLVAVVSQGFSERAWPGADPLGQRIRPGPARLPDGSPAPWRTVVGVVGDVRKSFTGDIVPDTYVPYAQDPRPFIFLMIRAAQTPAVAPMTLAPAVARVVSGIDVNLPLADVESMADVVSRANARPRFLAWLLSGFAAFAALLAVAGAYGIVGFAVRDRRREVALRLALGAPRGVVVRALVGQEGRFALAGLAGGLLAGVWLSRLLEHQLHGVTRLDPLTYVGVTLGLGVIVATAIAGPVWRAAGVAPLSALREE